MERGADHHQPGGPARGQLDGAQSGGLDLGVRRARLGILAVVQPGRQGLHRQQGVVAGGGRAGGAGQQVAEVEAADVRRQHGDRAARVRPGGSAHAVTHLRTPWTRNTGREHPCPLCTQLLPEGHNTAVDRRPTIVDVAREAGVSIAVVSYALNNRPGVSAETRARVLRVAQECGWRPSAAARSLRAGPKCVGLILPAGGGTFAGEGRLLRFITALQAALSEEQVGTLVQIADDRAAATAACVRWWAERQVFAVVLPDVQDDDPRTAELIARGIPVVGLDGPPGASAVAMVWADQAAATGNLAEYLLSLGHRRLARVTGGPELTL